jgi:hypothetical protein
MGNGGGIGQQATAALAPCASAGCHGGTQAPNLANNDAPDGAKAFVRNGQGATLISRCTDNHRGVSLQPAAVAIVQQWVTQQTGGLF